MEGSTESLVRRQKAHIVAIQRLRAGAREFPEARRGLEKLARPHIAKAATLAAEICRTVLTADAPGEESVGRLAR